MTIQQIIESLLRARLYHLGVVIRTDGGTAHDVLVREVHYEGSRSFVVVAPEREGSTEFCIPLARIRRVAARSVAGAGAKP